MTDSSTGRWGWMRGGWRDRIGASVALSLLAAGAASGEPPAPWEIQGYSQTPVWSGAERPPDASRNADVPAPWTDSGLWQTPPNQWTGRDWEPEPRRSDSLGPRWQSPGPRDGDGGYPGPVAADAHPPRQPADWGQVPDPGYGFRADQGQPDPWAPGRMPDGGAGGYSAGAHPGYRFRGDPDPVGSPWSNRSNRSNRSDGANYRFRPLNEGELDRRGRGSVWRPDEATTTPWQQDPSGPGADQDSVPGPAYGFEPNPWQVR